MFSQAASADGSEASTRRKSGGNLWTTPEEIFFGAIGFGLTPGGVRLPQSESHFQ